MQQASPTIDVGHTLAQNEVLLTGGSGFLGKVLLGLILDRFPQVKHLHVLLRPGRKLTAHQRFYGETLASPALAATASARGRDFLREKITVWSGDIGRIDCGIDPSRVEDLVGRVSLILNCAGKVDFFPPIDQSFRSNVDGAEHVVALAKQIGAKLVHVSTCYVCGEAEGLVEETDPVLGFYPRRQGPSDPAFNHQEEIGYCRARLRQIYDSSGAKSPGTGAEPSREVAERLIALGKQRAARWGWVNTYTYAKSLGEQILAAEPGLDYAIVRPAIVESALRFPFPGWVEGGRTAAPLVLMGLGGMKHWPMRSDNPLEVVPVDLVASAIVVVSALLLDGQSERVYQLGTADVNPILLGSLVALLEAESRKRRNGNGSLWQRLLDSPGGVRFVSAEQARARRVALGKRIRRAEAAIGAVRKILQKTGARTAPSLAKWSTSLRALGLQASLREQTLEQFLPFVLDNRYIFESENIRQAYARISQEDCQRLPWDPERIDWRDYWLNHQIAGIERWVQPQAVRQWTFKI